MSDIFEWTEQLRRVGIGVCLIHHTLDDKGRDSVQSKARGSDELSIRSHSEIIIIGKREIGENEIYRSVVGDYYAQAGVVVGIYFKVCKAAGLLTGMIRWMYLPYNDKDWVVIATTDRCGNIIDRQSTQGFLKESSQDYISEDGNEAITGLSSDALKVLDKMRQDKMPLKRKDVEEFLECAADKARATLDQLIEANHIVKQGESRATEYVLAG